MDHHGTGANWDNLYNPGDEIEQKRAFVTLLLAQKRRTDTLLELSNDVVWETDATGRFTFLNRSAVELFGEPIRHLIGRYFLGFDKREGRIANLRFMATLCAKGEARDFVTSINVGKFRKRLTINARIIFDARGLIEKVYGTIRDITRQHDAEQRLREQARRDALTGLYNRSALIERLESELCARRCGAMIKIDIDHFDRVNETLGPREGDAVIRAVGSLLCAELGSSERSTLYHLGGDAFAVICSPTSRKAVAGLGERLRLAVGRHSQRQGAAADLHHPREATPPANHTASAGVVLFPRDGNTPVELLRNARVAITRAKQAGRNRLMFFRAPGQSRPRHSQEAGLAGAASPDQARDRSPSADRRRDSQ